MENKISHLEGFDSFWKSVGTLGNVESGGTSGSRPRGTNGAGPGLGEPTGGVDP